MNDEPRILRERMLSLNAHINNEMANGDSPELFAGLSEDLHELLRQQTKVRIDQFSQEIDKCQQELDARLVDDRRLRRLLHEWRKVTGYSRATMYLHESYASDALQRNPSFISNVVITHDGAESAQNLGKCPVCQEFFSRMTANASGEVVLQMFDCPNGWLGSHYVCSKCTFKFLRSMHGNKCLLCQEPIRHVMPIRHAMPRPTDVIMVDDDGDDGDDDVVFVPDPESDSDGDIIFVGGAEIQ